MAPPRRRAIDGRDARRVGRAQAGLGTLRILHRVQRRLASVSATERERGGLVRELLGEHDVLPFIASSACSVNRFAMSAAPARPRSARGSRSVPGRAWRWPAARECAARPASRSPSSAACGAVVRRRRRGRGRRGRLAGRGAGAGSGRSGRGATAAARSAACAARALDRRHSATIGSLSIGEDTTRGGGSGVSRGGPAGSALARAFAQPAAAPSAATSADSGHAEKADHAPIMNPDEAARASSLRQKHTEVVPAGRRLHLDLAVEELNRPARSTTRCRFRSLSS